MEIDLKIKDLILKFGSNANLCVDEILSVIDVYPRYQMTESEIETVEYWKLIKNKIKSIQNEE